MIDGVITKHDLDRIVDAVEHEMEVKPIEKPRVVVKDTESDSDDSHMVNIEDLTCSCKDFEYNCNDEEYCKHLFHVVFRKHGML